MKRKGLSKRTRFEIFKRDGFRCLYCGATPVQKVLRVDHVKPVADGGTDDQTNLATSCFDCNAGKGPVPLETRKHAAGIATEADKERPEQIREWLNVQRDIEAARGEVVDDMLKAWSAAIGEPDPDIKGRLRACLSRNSPNDIHEAIAATSVKRLTGSRQLKYFYGVLRAKRGEMPTPPPPPPRARWSARAERVQRHLIAWSDTKEGHGIGDVGLEFARAAWAGPSVMEYAADFYDRNIPGCDRLNVRGLVLLTEPRDSGKLSWRVEDDPGCDIAVEVLREVWSAVNEESYRWSSLRAESWAGAPPMTVEECREATLHREATFEDGEAFLVFLRTGDEKQLRECRERFGWPCPKWMAD